MHSVAAISEGMESCSVMRGTAPSTEEPYVPTNRCDSREIWRISVVPWKTYSTKSKGKTGIRERKGLHRISIYRPVLRPEPLSPPTVEEQPLPVRRVRKGRIHPREGIRVPRLPVGRYRETAEKICVPVKSNFARCVQIPLCCCVLEMMNAIDARIGTKRRSRIVKEAVFPSIAERIRI